MADGQDFIRLGRLLQANITANAELAEENRKAIAELARIAKLVERGETRFGIRGNTDVRDYQALSLNDIARDLGVSTATLTESIAKIEREIGRPASVRGNDGRRTGELTPAGWEVAVVGLMLDRALALIRDPSVPDSARQRILFRMIYRLDQDSDVETSPHNLEQAEKYPQPFNWLEELVAPPDPDLEPYVDYELQEREQAQRRQLEEEDASFVPPLPERI